MPIGYPIAITKTGKQSNL